MAHPKARTTVSDDGWSEKYACFTKQIGAFTASVNYSAMQKTRPGYEVSFAGRRLPNMVQDLADAKSAALLLARRMLTEAIESLDG